VVPLIAKYPNLLVVQTFSKSRSLAGGRLGLGIACPELIDDLNRVRGSFHPYNLNRLSILAGAAAMNDGEYFEKTRTAIIETREKTRAALLEMGCTVTQSCTNFLFVKLPGVDGQTCLEKLRAQNILVRWWNSPRIIDYTRVTIGTPQQMERYLEAVASIIKEAQV
jgi:histidinol-phosphate aminotransferase